MGSTLRRRRRLWLFKVLFVLVAAFAAGLVTSGVVAGAGPLAALSTSTETTETETTATETTESESTETDPTEEETTEGETTDTTPTETTETESTESETTETAPSGGTGTASISTIKDDYVPLELVDLTGESWQPNESVEIFVDDHEGKTWSHTTTVTADELGGFYYEFRLPSHFVATYSVMATGALSGTAEWTFADSISQGSLSNPAHNTGNSELTISAPAATVGTVYVAHMVAVDSVANVRFCPAQTGWNTATAAPNNLLFRDSQNKIVSQVFWRVATSDNASAVSYNFNFRTAANCTGSNLNLAATGRIIAFNGVDTVTAIDAAGGTGGTASQSSGTAPSVTTTTANTFVLRLFGIFKNATINPATNRIYTIGSSSSKERSAAAFGIAQASAGATGTAVATFTSAEWVAQTVALRMAAPANSPPSGADKTISIAEDNTYTFAAADFGYTDPNAGDAMSAVRIDTLTLAAGSTLRLSGADVTAGQIIPAGSIPNLVFTPAGNASGSPYASFTFSVGDTNGPAFDTTPNTIRIDVTAVDDPPVAVGDTATVGEDSTATTILVLANDTDVDGGPKTITSATQPPNGSVTVAGDSLSLAYTPDPDYCNGGSPTDDFTYMLDGGSSATVAITVTCVNDAPTCEDVSITTDEDTPGSQAADCTDVDGDPLTYVAGPAATGISGVSGGDLTYDPDGQFEALDDGASGNDSFTYVANDGTVDSAPADVSVTINGANDAPECAAVTISVSEDGPAGTTGPACTDVEGDALTYNAGAASGAGISGFSAGNLTYDPNGQFESLDDTETANDSFPYTANDGDATSAPANVGVTINGANDAPTCQDASITTNENTLGSTAADCADVDVEPLTYAASPAAGAGVSGAAGNDLTYDPNGQFEGLDTGETGSDSFTYTANDGTAASNAASVAVTITGVNDAPVCEDVTITVSEDGPAGSVDPDCTDVDDEPLTYTVTQPTKGVSSLTAGQLAFDPDGDFEGLDTGESDTTDGDFTYTANDATVDSNAAAAEVTVNGANDAPVCQPASITTDEDTLGSTPANCADVDVEPLIYAAGPAAGAGVSGVAGNDLTYDPNGQFEHLGTGDTANDSFTYTANDGDATSAPATVSVTITGVNDAPVVDLTGPATANEGDTKTYEIDTADPDSSLFTLDARACGASGSVVPASVVFDASTGDGSFDCMFADDDPTGTAFDTSTVSVTVSDDEPASDGDTLDVTVSNLAPNVTIVSPTAGTYPVGAPIAVTATFTDAGKPDTHTCTINGGPGTVTYTPPGSGTGTCTGSVTPTAGAFTVTVTVSDDDLGTTTKSVALNALYSIYAHERCSGGAGKGILVNGSGADIDGGIHSNGNFTINGSSFQSATASLYRPQSGCSTVYSPSRVNFGPPSPNAPVNVPLQSWPWNPSRSSFPCTFPIKDDYVFNASNMTIPSGVYCARKSFKINGSNVTGNITVLAPEIVVNGRNVNLSWHTGGMLLFAINPQTGALSSKEIVVNGELAVGGGALTGVIHNPGGGVKVNGTVRLHQGFVQGLWVEVNYQGFRMTY